LHLQQRPFNCLTLGVFCEEENLKEQRTKKHKSYTNMYPKNSESNMTKEKLKLQLFKKKIAQNK